ncbi:acyltransferase family protein [Clostridium beijerinckii]|uniref:acyltransferase family protein n=1 Tax=Clostridium beijerinckii TaxID=1520 RepID=UPI00080A11FF|nr:acyltransferase family protein [Clostridium beijerinckii]OCA99776.1 hypothetical protein BGS1_17155 [Clostridium beijerinckii]
MKSEVQECLSRNRIEYVDVFRGIAIVLMVMGHIGFSGHFDKYIHMFHMPLWFFISGWFYKEQDEELFTIVKKKAKNLVIPYIIFGIVQYPAWLLFNYGSSTDLLEPIRNYFWINTNLVMPVAGALWFLTCLFFTEIFFLNIRRKVDNEKIFFILIIILSILGTLFYKIFLFRLPWAIDTAFVALGFYYVGYEFKLHVGKKIFFWLLNMPITITILAFFINFALCFVNGYVNLRTGAYAFVPLFWLNSVTAILVYWNISKGLDKVQIKLVRVICNHIKYIGRNSIIYLCLNQLCILIFSKIINFANYGVLIWLVGQGILLIATLGFLYISSRVITQTKLRVIIGKK